MLVIRSLAILSLGGLLGACQFGTAASAQDGAVEAIRVSDVLTPEQSILTHGTFDTYWYQGLAEMDRYSLQQSRYGEVHPGEAVLIYVTEDFLADVQIKHEFGDGSTAVPILKLNSYRRFYTGIYPYTLMTSVFTPISEPAQPSLKVTMSALEWCGMAYMQLNRRDEAYQGILHSYFQAEGDATFEVDATLEDELWTWIRRDPASLPVGEVSLLPSAVYLRLLHRPADAQIATLTLDDVTTSPYGDTPARRYTIDYRDIDRAVNIYFEPGFPHRILAWEESGSSVMGGPQTTTGVLTNSVLLDYWNLHGLEDASYRDALGLEY